MTTKMRWVLGVCIVIGVVLLAYILGTLLGYGIKQWWVFTDPTPTSTTIAKSPTPTVVVPTATSKAQKAEPTVKPAKPTALVEPTAAPQPTILVGEEGPCKGGSTNVHFLETQEGIGNSGFLEYSIDLGVGEVALIWGSQVVPGFGSGRSFVTIAGPWVGKVGIFNGAVRQGRVLTDLAQTQKFWGKIIDCDLQRNIPLEEQKNLYEQFKVNW